MPKRKPSLMIVDDEPNFSESLAMALEDDFSITTAGTVGGARVLLKSYAPDAVLLDIRLPDGDALMLLDEFERDGAMPVVIIMTAFATVDSAVKALKRGVADYFTKPLDIERLKRELMVHLENRALHVKIDELDREIKKITPSFITSGAGKMKEIVERVPMVAPLAIPILIKGETGTGKERLAAWIHALSGAKGGLVAINCSALPREILESELFGYVKGAFSGAASVKEGLIERAEDGTLFLDEIGELPEDVQAKFLRVLEDGVYYKVGDPKERRVKFRLIAATNKDLSDPANRFRQDLFYRINGITFDLVPLRERRHDVPLLAAAFIKEANASSGKKVSGFTPKAMERLMTYAWPGNIRELKWCIHRAVAIAPKDVVDLEELSVSEAFNGTREEGATARVALEGAMEDLERRYIEDALKKAGNNKTEAAKILDMSVRALHYKIKKYGL